jgi:hypothetical protein
MIDIEAIRARFAELSVHLDERGRRLLAASEARVAGYGGIAAVSRATGLAASTIGRGLKDLSNGLPPGRVRRQGGGGKPVVERDPGLLPALLSLVEPEARGDPMSPLRWTCKSLRRLAADLTARGHRVSRTVVGELLAREKFSLQANRKTREGSEHPDRDAQFAHINASVTAALAERQPVISVDTKKKELVGNFKNAGREWRLQGDPEEVRVHDFLLPELGRAVPYGLYDLAANAGWVSVGMNHDTAAFAVQTIRRWWQQIGQVRYPTAERLVVTADGGGGNGWRLRLWKYELQRLADEIGLGIEVHHLPPGTSSRVEDRRGGCSLPVGCRRRFRPPPQSGLTWLRFLSPLVKPDVQISRIRLSPASSSLRTWQVSAMERQGIKAECLVEVLVRVLAVPGACLSATSHQPALKSPLHIPAHDPVGR